MFKAECSFSFSVSVTKARAIAGVCNFIVNEGYYTPDHQLQVEITEFDQRMYGSENADVYNIADEWVESTSTVSVDPEGVKRFAELHQQIEDEPAIAKGEDDW